MPRISIDDRVRLDNTRVRSLSFIVTKGCNLRCSYCYEKHDQRNQEIMDFSIIKEAIHFYMEGEPEYNFLEIDFFGGEPFLAFPLIQQTVEWVSSREWPKRYLFSIGTNGTILTPEMKEWLAKYKKSLSVSFSIDGTKTAHDLTRSNSYDALARNIPFFREHWPNQFAKMTISTDTIPYVARGVVELEELGIQFTANMGFEDMWGDHVKQERLLDLYEEQLEQLVDYYALNHELFPVSPLLTAFPQYLAIPGYGKSPKTVNLRYCGAGHEMVVIDIDGKSYPCHRFIPWITGCPAPVENANCQSGWGPISCGECKLIHSCPTCAGYNWEKNRDTGLRTTFHCESYKREVIATCKLEAKRLIRYLNTTFSSNISDKEKRELKIRLDTVKALLADGI